MRKLWYSSVIEHIRAISNGIVLILPGAIIGHVSFWNIILVLGAFVCFSANKTYAGIVCEELLGNILGTQVKSVLRMILLMITLGISGLGAILGSILGGEKLAFMLFIVFTGAITFILALLASIMFDKMERNE